MPTPFTIPLAVTPATALQAAALRALNLYGLSRTTVAAADPWGICPAGIPRGDLELTDPGELRWTDGPEQARQEIESRYAFFLGEYFLDTRQGLPYYRDVFVKNPNSQTILDLFERTALSVPGVTNVANFTYALDSRTRKLGVTGEALWSDGQPIPLDLSYIL